MGYPIAMIKSIYINPLERDFLEESNANHLIVSEHGLNQENWGKLKKLGMTLSIAVDAFNKEDCPAYPEAQKRLFEKIKVVLGYNPSEVWFDFFRFGGDCTTIEEAGINLAHQECEFCRGKGRKEIIKNLAQRVKENIEGKSKVGFFAGAFKDNESPALSEALGLDYSELGNIFDLSSPMLYHRMLGKPVDYIHEYTEWLTGRTGKPVLPIIQIKDMPDDLEDKMTQKDIEDAYQEAIKPPSLGVAIFWWKHALEKNKTGIISELFSS